MMVTRLCVSVALVCLLGHGGAKRTRVQRPAPQQPISKIPAVQNLDMQQLSGKWFLISVASNCRYLQENNFRLESTTMTLTAPTSPNSPLIANTVRKLNQQCWNIMQKYVPTQSSGRFMIPEPRQDIEVVVSETDYASYAILYYLKRGQVTMKLYGRSTRLPDSIQDKFEQIAEKQNINIDHIYPFPKYGFCESVEKSL